MAEKILKVKVIADTSGMASIEKSTASIVKKSEELINLDQSIKNLAEQKVKAYEKLTATIDKLNNSEKLSVALAENAAKTSINSYNKQVESVNKLIDALKKAKVEAANVSLEGYKGLGGNSSTSTSINKGSSYLGNKPIASSTGYTNLGGAGTSENRNYTTIASTRLAAEKTAFKDYTDKVNTLQKMQTTKNKAELDKQAFDAKASYNSRYTMYAAMFDEIEAKNQKASPAAKIDTKSIDAYNKTLSNQNSIVDIAIQKHKSLFTHIAEIGIIYKALNTTLQLTQQALLNIPKAGIQQQATQANLLGIFGTEQGFKNLKEVSDIADDAGQSLTTLEEAYGRYAASATLAGAEQESVNKSFKDFAETATIMSLTEDKVNSLFLALDQMYAKGTVQSEEIKKQLGNVLPGAVEIGAQAIGKSPAAFMEAMKKNEVLAKDFVPKFAALYRKIFGGPDDSVFRLVSDRLLSNLNRVENEYTRINRAIFASTQSAMNSVVKLTADALTSVRDNLTGIGQATEILAGLIAVRLAGATAVAITNIGTLLTTLGRFTSVVTGLSAPVATVGASLVYMYGRLNDLNVAYESSTGFTIKFKDQQVTLTSYLEATGIRAIQTLSETYDSLNQSLQSIINLDVSGLWDALIPNSKDLAEFNAFTKAFKDTKFLTTDASDFATRYTKNLEENLKTSAEGQTTIMAEAAARDMEKYLATFQGKSATAVSEAIAKGKITTTEQITKALEGTVDIPAPKLPPIIEESSTENLKGAKNAYKQFEDLLKTQQENTKLYLAEEQTKYSQNLITYADYYNRKKDILEKSYESEASLQRGIKDRAEGAGDNVKSVDAEEKLNQLKAQHSVDLLNLEAERYSNAFAYSRELTQITLEYYTKTGNEEAAAKIQLEEKYGLIKNALRTQIDLGDAAKQIDLDRINAVEKIALTEARLVPERQKLEAETNKYTDSLNRINVLKNIGAISDLQAAVASKEANQEKLAFMQKEISLDEELLSATESGTMAYARLEEQIRKGKAALESFRLEADTVAQFINNKLGGAFDSSFSSFVSGSKTASQAFQSFSQDVVKAIGDIIAQEIRSALFSKGTGLLSSLFSAAGSATGGGFSGNGPLMSYQNAFSNGGAATGLASASGTILSSPTYFPNAKVIPFANGGIVAGEAGAETVLPLKRGKNGKLGVAAESGQANITNIYQVTVQHTGKESGDELGSKVAEALIRDIARKEIASAARPQNSLNRTTKVA